MGKRIFLICPVRSGQLEEESRQYVEALEYMGHQVHYPPRDVDQTDDGVGLGICVAHREAMHLCDEVHIIYHPESTGWLFDFGMAFALRKPIYLVNYSEIDFPAKKHYINAARVLSHAFNLA